MHVAAPHLGSDRGRAVNRKSRTQKQRNLNHQHGNFRTEAGINTEGEIMNHQKLLWIQRQSRSRTLRECFRTTSRTKHNTSITREAKKSLGAPKKGGKSHKKESSIHQKELIASTQEFKTCRINEAAKTAFWENQEFTWTILTKQDVSKTSELLTTRAYSPYAEWIEAENPWATQHSSLTWSPSLTATLNHQRLLRWCFSATRTTRTRRQSPKPYFNTARTPNHRRPGSTGQPWGFKAPTPSAKQKPQNWWMQPQRDTLVLAESLD